MKTNLFIILIIFSFQFIYCQENISIYVSNFGKDNWTGLKPESNKQGTDGPFYSLNKAIDFISKRNNSENSAFIVFLRKGIYYFDNSVVLDGSKLKYKNISLTSYKNEVVDFVGCKKISGFEKIKDESILRRLNPGIKDKVLFVDLKKRGITDYGKIDMRGSPGMELFFDGKRMPISRYPNEGWLKIANIPQIGDKLLNEGLQREKRFDNIPVGRHYGKIKYTENKPNFWSKENDIYVHGYWTWDWSDSYQRIKTIDTSSKEITIAEPHHHYGYTKNQRYYFLNILEEIDEKGEYYFDREKGLLYFLPPDKIDNKEIFVSMLDSPILEIDSCHDVKIEKINFQYSRGNAIVIKVGKNNLIAGCNFKYLGKDAVVIEAGENNGVISSNISDVSLGGIILKGGDRKTLSISNNFAINNHIYDYSKWIRTGQMAINISGVGTKVSNNLIHNAPHEGMLLSGNEHVVEYNELYNLCNETGDAGAIHTGRNYTWRGNTIQYNYFHDLKGPGLHGVVAIYLDDFSTDFKVIGNICYRAGRGTLIGGGRENLIQNNIYIDCHPSIVLDARGLSWASYYFDGTFTYLAKGLEEMNYKQPPYSVRYPKLLEYDKENLAIPKDNKIINNISFGGRWLELYDYFAYDFSVNEFKNNYIGDNEICKRVKEKPKGWEPYYLNLDTSDDYVVFRSDDEYIKNEFKNDKILNKDPGFIDLDKKNFKLNANSSVFNLGFKQIPFEKIGLFKDEYRKITIK